LIAYALDSMHAISIPAAGPFKNSAFTVAPEHVFFPAARSGHASIRVGRRLSHLFGGQTSRLRRVFKWAAYRVSDCSGQMRSSRARFTVLMKLAVDWEETSGWLTWAMARRSSCECGSFSHAARNELPIDKSAGKTCVLRRPRVVHFVQADARARSFFKHTPHTFSINCTQMRHCWGFLQCEFPNRPVICSALHLDTSICLKLAMVII
jgi:hypothetical protein